MRRQRPDGTWTEPFRVPRSYLAHHAELAYAGNVHVAQGRTVDTAHLLVTDTLSRQALYVGMTRGRESNTAHVVTGNTAPPGHEPYQQAAPESVLADVLQRDGDDLSATEQIRHAQEWAGGTGHLLTLWSAAVRQTLYPDIDQQITARLTESEAWRYQREPSRPVLQHTLRDAQLAGHDIGPIIDRITAAPMDGARSIASVLHGRLQRLQLPAQGHGVTWAQRTPQNAPALAHELAAGLDDRRRELGERALANPEPWLTRHLGPPPGPDASPVLREDYAWRAGTAAAYREARGITDPQQAVSFGPHPGPELEALRKDTLRALEIADEHAEIRAMSRGELEAQVLEADRAQATAPPDTSSQLRLTSQAEADAWQQSADAEAEHDQVRRRKRQVAGRRAGRADEPPRSCERPVRGMVRPDSQHPGDSREGQGRAAAPRAATARRESTGTAEHGRPGGGSSRRTPTLWTARSSASTRLPSTTASRGRRNGSRKPGMRDRDAAAPGRDPQLEQSRPGTAGAQADPEPGASELETPAVEATEPGLADDGRAARLDELQARADQAARRIDAQRAELDASSAHTARIQRETQAEPETGRQTETPYDMEMEL